MTGLCEDVPKMRDQAPTLLRVSSFPGVLADQKGWILMAARRIPLRPLFLIIIPIICPFPLCV